MFFSFSMWSTCFDWMISCFFIDFTAYFALGSARSQATLTRPKAPKREGVALSRAELDLTFAESFAKDHVVWSDVVKLALRWYSLHHH